MIRVPILTVGAGLLLTTGCEASRESSPLDLASYHHGAGQAPALPFHGHIEGQLALVPPFQPGSLDACNANFSGDPAHPGPSVSGFDDALGVFSIVGRIQLHSAFCFDPDSPASGGTGVLIAMNGDRIFIGFTNAAAGPDATGTIPVHGSQWITGGTGRFDGASGGQVCQFSVVAATLVISGSCRGDIRFDPSRPSLVAAGLRP